MKLEHLMECWGIFFLPLRKTLHIHLHFADHPDESQLIHTSGSSKPFPCDPQQVNMAECHFLQIQFWKVEVAVLNFGLICEIFNPTPWSH
jgi:hypothetical protein